MKFIKNQNVISENLSEKTFVLNNETGMYIELNETASDLWCSFTEKSSTDELIDYLLSEYDIDENIARADVDEFVKDCFSNKLILNIDI
jgi:hypothetical protein